ncbi:MAG: hypothetical protein MK078_07980 [Crocinitomicaceae bacterium]|nr:hypothetical protein [Crocinitomicaceae bacterium]
MNCKKVTYLIEKRAIAKLNFWEKIQIRLHKSVCNCCRNYDKDTTALNRMLLKVANITEPTKLLDKLEKERLKEALRNEIK